jgi:predicted HTH transcriptional regulator
MAGVDVLQLVTDGERRKALDNFLVLQAPLIEEAMREQVEGLIDEINDQLPDPYRLRLVHEDTADYPEIVTSQGEAWDNWTEAEAEE